MSKGSHSIAAASLLALALTLFAACQGCGQRGGASAEDSAVAAKGKFGQFKIADLDRNEQDVSELISKQRYTIIDFWASWCAPCRAEMPVLVSLYEKYKDSGLGIIGISFDSDYNDWKNAVDSLKMGWTQLSELRGWDSAAGKSLSVNAIPFSIVVDSQSRIIAVDQRGKRLVSLIDKLMKPEE